MRKDVAEPMSIQMFILGLLYDQPLHPYQLKKVIKTNHWEKLVNLNDGTLYYGFDVLHKKHHIEIADIIEEEHRPTKKVYRITESGKEELRKEIYSNLKNHTKLQSLYSALLFIDCAERDVIISTLKKRISKLDKTLEDEPPLLARDGSQTRMTELITNHAHKHLSIEKTWLVQLLDYLEQN